MSFFKRNKTLEIYSPVVGTPVSITEVPDITFSSKLLGDGVGILPYDNLITSPVEGEIIMMQDSLHAIGIRTKDNIEILLHIGLDTVTLKGKGFTPYISVGSFVHKGDKLVSLDLDYIKSMNLNTIVILIVLENENIKQIQEHFTEPSLLTITYC